MKLDIQDLHVCYGMIKAVKGVSFNVDEGEIVTLIGANGAGKTSILRTITGLERAQSGRIKYSGIDITNKASHLIVAMGVVHVPEGRRIFTNLSVIENLRMGANLCKDKNRIKKNMEEVFKLFPRLKERRNQSGMTLSGGEQQMLAVGRAMMAGGDMILLDEPSMGLAPLYIEEIFNVIKGLSNSGKTVLLVEQNAFQSLNIADRAYVLETGSISIEGDAKSVLKDPVIKEAYLGK